MKQRSALSVRTAFTLVELLVVIGVISVLIAILVPAVMQARIRALKTVDASNLRQIAMASFMYANEFHGYLPLCGGAYSDPVPPQLWKNEIWPMWTMFGGMDLYFTTRYNLQKVKQCPLYTWDHNQTGPFGFWLPVANPQTPDFGYTMWEGRAYHRTDFWNEFTGPQRLGRKVRKVIVSDIYYKCLGDGNSLGTGWFSPHAKTDIIGYDGSVPFPPTDMHVAYTDGAVELLPPARIQFVFGSYVNMYADGLMTDNEGQ